MEYDSLTKYLEKIYKKVGSDQFTIYDICELEDAKTTANYIAMLRSTGMLKIESGGFMLTENAKLLFN